MILDQIAEKTRERVSEERRLRPLSEVRAEAEARCAQERSLCFPFERALSAPGISFLCEVKRCLLYTSSDYTLFSLFLLV